VLSGLLILLIYARNRLKTSRQHGWGRAKEFALWDIWNGIPKCTQAKEWVRKFYYMFESLFFHDLFRCCYCFRISSIFMLFLHDLFLPVVMTVVSLEWSILRSIVQEIQLNVHFRIWIYLHSTWNTRMTWSWVIIITRKKLNS
jgi:hypothetical protein